MPTPLTQGERADFRAFCRGVTDAQIREIVRKEETAGRITEAEIARGELARRGLEE